MYINFLVFYADFVGNGFHHTKMKYRTICQIPTTVQKETEISSKFFKKKDLQLQFISYLNHLHNYKG